MRMHQLTICVMVILVLPLCTDSPASEAIVMSSINSPPYYIADARPGERRGAAIEIAVAAWKKVDVNVSFTFIPIARAVWSVVEPHHTPLLGTPQWFTKENKEDSVESVDLLTIRFVFFYKKDKFPEGLTYETLQDLKRYRIGNVRGSSTIPLLREAGLDLDLVSLVEQNFKQLFSDRVDLVVGVDLSGWEILQNLYPDALEEFATIDKPFFSADVSAIFFKTQTDLIQKFKTGLDEILKDGTYRKIVEKYVGKDMATVTIVPEPLRGKMK